MIEGILSCAALAVSTLAFFNSRRHQKLSLTPFIVSHEHLARNGDGLAYTFELRNQGLGPARFTNATLFLDDNVFAGSGKVNLVEELVTARIAGRANYVVRMSAWPGKAYSITAGQAYPMLDLFFPGTTRSDQPRLSEILKGMHLRIEYASFYGVQHVFDTRNQTTERTAV